MTVAQLTERLTQEELTSWAAYFDIRNEQEQKAMDQAKAQGKAMSGRARQTKKDAGASQRMDYSLRIAAIVEGRQTIKQLTADVKLLSKKQTV